jgi:hypothetical protein
MDSLTFIDSVVMLTRVKDTALTGELARRSLRMAQAISTGDALIKAYNINGNAWSLSRMDSAFYTWYPRQKRSFWLKKMKRASWAVNFMISPGTSWSMWSAFRPLRKPSGN